MAKSKLGQSLSQPVSPIVSSIVIGLAMLGFLLSLIPQLQQGPGPTSQTRSSSPTPTPQVQTFTSLNLGISFQYPSNFQPVEVGRRVYLSSGIYVPRRQGELSDDVDGNYWIKVFTKDKNSSLEQSIRAYFLSSAQEQLCRMVSGRSVTGPNIHQSYQLITLRMVSGAKNESVDTLTDRAKQCPSPYTDDNRNGNGYFLYDPSHPTRFVFVHLGQDNALVGNAHTWDQTLTLIDN